MKPSKVSKSQHTLSPTTNQNGNNFSFILKRVFNTFVLLHVQFIHYFIQISGLQNEFGKSH
jgi:hypothetical protein